MPKSESLLGPQARKLEPALRMAVGGSLEVNVARAEQAPAIAVEETPATLEALAAQRPLEERVVLADAEELPAPPLPAVPAGVRTSVFIQTISPDVEARFPGQTARRGDLVLAELGLDELTLVLEDPHVNWVEAGEEVRVPQPDVTTGMIMTPTDDDTRSIGREDLHDSGARTLIGIIDVGGFDFAHSDFRRRGGGTRFERIWDQGGDTRPSPRSRNDGGAWAAFDYGSELRQAEFDAAIAASERERLPAWELEPQSQMVAGSHATHVASIAAGNRGVARRSPIAAVLISLPADEATRRRTFTDSSRIAHAVDYLCTVADELGLRVSINISLGTNGHAHDGSSPTNRWIDQALTVRGRSVCVAAGNAGQEAPRAPGDPTYRTGRIHTSGTIAAAGLEAVIDWVVVGSGIRDDIVDISENEFELWYGPQDRFAVTLHPPDGPPIGPVRPGQYIENRQRPDGTFVSIYNELYHPANGGNYIAIYLSPYLGSDRVAGISRGTWRVRLHGLDVRDGAYHAWIERDDFAGIWPAERPVYWRFPSSFGAGSFVDSHTVTSLGCGQDTITVANLVAAREAINVTSSQGPTRDGRPKPDAAAPGTDVVAANGFGDPSEPWIAMTGTSMASPYVAGVVALMLSAEPDLTAAQIEGIIQRTAHPLPSSDYRWRNDAGFGVIDPVACVTEARVVNAAEELEP